MTCSYYDVFLKQYKRFKQKENIDDQPLGKRFKQPVEDKLLSIDDNLELSSITDQEFMPWLSHDTRKK